MKAVLFLLSLALFTSCLRGRGEFVRVNLNHAKSVEEEGAIQFLMGDFGSLKQHGLNSNILPFKVSIAALLYAKGFDAKNNDSNIAINELLQTYGFMPKAKIMNLPEGADFKLPKYNGIFKGRLHAGKYPFKLRIEGSGFSCASCHGGVSYQSDGTPDPSKMFLGSPNTSINLEKYTNDVFTAFTKIINKKRSFLSYLLYVFPSTTKMEYRTIKLIYKKSIVNKVRSLQRNLGRATPMINGSPGVTNGVASLKYQLNILDKNKIAVNETGFTAIPGVFDREFRTSLLYDGVYKVKNFDDSKLTQLAKIVTFFTVPTSANLPSVAAKKVKDVESVLTFLGSAKRQGFPGFIDTSKSKRGRQVYKMKCASCHGEYSEGFTLENKPKLISFPNKVIAHSEMNTDPSRLDVVDEKFVDKVNSTVMGKYLIASKADGYIAPILSGLWHSAPFLHNGSVSSLWTLMNPELREDKFMVGGHKLNFKTLGVEYPDGYTPWSTSAEVDTNKSGYTNTGHESPFDTMSSDDKWDLIEYLKLI